MQPDKSISIKKVGVVQILSR